MQMLEMCKVDAAPFISQPPPSRKIILRNHQIKVRQKYNRNNGVKDFTHLSNYD